jgi:hypothetical protein
VQVENFVPLKACVMRFVETSYTIAGTVLVTTMADRRETVTRIVKTAHTGVGETRTALILSD